MTSDVVGFIFRRSGMANYYDEIINEIKQKITQGKAEEALTMVNKELSMPYIPSDVEPLLRKLKRDLLYQVSEKKGSTEMSLDELLTRLHGRPEEQLSAAVALSRRNLRECLPEIQDWLSRDPLEQAGALIVEAIAEQQIGEEFVWQRKGVEYTFYGDGLTPVAESRGFLKAEELLQEWLSNDHPDLYEMAKKLLVQEVYMFLPLIL
jgi:hypothetical protein